MRSVSLFLPPGLRSSVSRSPHGSEQQPCPKSTRMPRSGLPRVFVRALACTSMQTFGGRCSCTSSVRSTQTASSQQHSPQYSPRVRRPSNRRCSAEKRRDAAAAPHRAGMGIKRRPVESPGAHACAAAPRALHTRLLSSTHTFVEPGHQRLPLESPKGDAQRPGAIVAAARGCGWRCGCACPTGRLRDRPRRRGTAAARRQHRALSRFKVARRGSKSALVGFRHAESLSPPRY